MVAAMSMVDRGCVHFQQHAKKFKKIQKKQNFCSAKRIKITFLFHELENNYTVGCDIQDNVFTK